MAVKKKKKSIALKIRNYFFTGVVVLIPIGFTLYLTKFLISISSKLIPESINPNTYLHFSIPGLEIILTIIFITIVGGLSLSFLGKKFLQLVDDLFKRIPILRTIYSAIGQMTETFTKKDNSRKSVVLVEYPKKGSWAVGFATKENSGELSEFKVARIIKTNKHPNADRLKVCQVETAQGNFQVVCGAPNAKKGMLGVFAPAEE